MISRNIYLLAVQQHIKNKHRKNYPGLIIDDKLSWNDYIENMPNNRIIISL